MVNYATRKFNKEHMAKAMGRNLPISFKQTVEVCNFIRSKDVNNAKEILKKVSEKKMFVPFRRFNSDLGHKKKGGPGRFPVKTSNELIKLLEVVEANAQFKGLNTSNLVIMHICAHKGGKVWHFGRKRRREMKRTNVEIIVEERAKKEIKEKVEKLSIKKEDEREEKKDIQNKKEIKKIEKKTEDKKAAKEKND